ncbi:CRISPR-associated protein Cas4 [Sphaerochaeta pleomorpha str. Grapes]|uniref:CRISPR-associated exonuclease Cas4 n=1 Tax=Sphaerochaeta pleomorpha (strain ATCC BAA-1885 / DSM 22778 / Grapes) TaxID=158190 RepID=G8QQN7_SPHPG|nr:CRISPR-associated protein Cas4 [Sphaerochaeta pleomorpha]AEV30967.1 CRISPR-associated protein Cas4 [Sphaerochaeta pleomorpha str. Grapes]
MFDERDLLPISSIQHLLYCERQFALIHLEGLWDENRFTVEGDILHERVDMIHHESRKLFYQEYSLNIRSMEIGLVGICDLVEVLYTPNREIETICPVEFKRGSAKQTDVDLVQLCAQAICLEEIFAIKIPKGQIFYLQDHRRVDVLFDNCLITKTKGLVRRAQELLKGSFTPLPVYHPKLCDACSLKEICCPKIISSRQLAVSDYVKSQISFNRMEYITEGLSND